MKYFLIIVAMLFSGCRVAYPSVGVSAPRWHSKCVTDYHCTDKNNCRASKVCYSK
jgi:hypothetical protein